MVSKLIEEYFGDFELIVVEVQLDKKSARFVTGYGPQENLKEEQRRPFFAALDMEIGKAVLNGCSVFIKMESNSKLGKDLIPGNPHNQSPNGRILAEIIKRNSSNWDNVKEWSPVIKDRVDETVIDVVIVSEDLIPEINKKVVDENPDQI